MADPHIGQPGVKADRNATPRRVTRSDNHREFYPGGVPVDGAISRDLTNTGDTDILQAGTLLGMVIASKKFAVSIMGNLGVLHDTSVVTTALTLPAAVAVELDRRIGQSGNLTLTGPVVTDGTLNTETVAFTAVNTTTGVVTITATTNDFAIGTWVQAADGSEILKGLVNDGFGLPVFDRTDQTNETVDLETLIVGAFIRTSQVLSVSADTTLIAEMKKQLRASGLGYLFDDDFGA